MGTSPPPLPQLTPSSRLPPLYGSVEQRIYSHDVENVRQARAYPPVNTTNPTNISQTPRPDGSNCATYHEDYRMMYQQQSKQLDQEVGTKVFFDNLNHPGSPTLQNLSQSRMKQDRNQNVPTTQVAPTEREQRQQFLVFMYTLFKLIDESAKTDEPSKVIKVRARQIVKECTNGHRLGIEGYSPLIAVIGEKLKRIKGMNEHWEEASWKVHHFWSRRRKRPQDVVQDTQGVNENADGSKRRRTGMSKSFIVSL